MAHRGKRYLVVGHRVGPLSQHHADCDVLVDDDEPGRLGSVDVGVVGGDVVQLGLELAHEVTGH